MIAAAALRLSLTVLSLNMDKQCGAQSLNELASLKFADVVLLQEVVDGPRCHAAEEAAQRLGMRHVYAKAFRLNQDFDEGLAILSRYPVSDVRIIPLSHHELHFHTRVRVAIALTAATPEGPIRVVDVHLDNRVSSEEKLEQLKPLWDEVAHRTGPVILGGDFNTGDFRWAKHVVPLPGLDHQREAVAQAMEQHGFTTALNDAPPTLKRWRQHLDWIYARGLHPEDSGVIPVRFSDHNAVWTSFQSIGKSDAIR